jgi:hypothetical protein
MKEQGGERQSLSFATPLYRFDNVKAQAPVKGFAKMVVFLERQEITSRKEEMTDCHVLARILA